MKFAFQTGPGIVVLVLLFGCMTSSQSDVVIHPQNHKLSRELIQLQSAGRKVRVGGGEIRQMRVTGYCPCEKCCNWKKDFFGNTVVASGENAGKPKIIGMTASGYPAASGTLAADRSIPFGTVVDVRGYGTGLVLDRGSAITGNRLDLFFKTHQEASQWGVRTMNVTLWPDRETWRESLKKSSEK